MESPTAPTPAPAQAPAPTVSAEFDAASKGDFSAFKSASDAVRAGKPLADVAATPAAPDKKGLVDKLVDAVIDDRAPDAPAPPERQVSKRQQQINDYERTIAELRAENTRLKTPPAAPREPDRPAAPPVEAQDEFPDIEEWSQQNPNGTLKQYNAAHYKFLREQEQRAEVEQRRTAHREQIQREQGDRYGANLHEAWKDPEFGNQIPPAVLQARPLSALPPDEQQGATFANFVTEAGLRSEDAASFYRYLHANQDAAVSIAKLHPTQWLEALIRLDGRVTAAKAASKAPEPSAEKPAAAPSTITSAPPPPPSVSNRAGASADPAASAVARGDFAAFQRNEDAKRRERAGVR